MSNQPICARCASTGWVCENHDDLAWDAGEVGCDCGGAGMPCPDCNTCHPPRFVDGGTVIWTAEDGWAN